MRLWVAVEGNLHVCSVMLVGVFETDAYNSTMFVTHPLIHDVPASPSRRTQPRGMYRTGSGGECRETMAEKSTEFLTR